GRRFEVVGLAAGTSRELLARQIRAVKPRWAALRSQADGAWLRALCPEVDVVCGDDAASELASRDDVDVVVNAVVGAAGLAATLAGLEAGRTVALANKESLVVGGALVARALASGGGRILPIDSEHSALLQALDAGRREDVDRLLLTASGGPFLEHDLDAIEKADASQALRHPTWNMGARITVDSATLVNKAFEVVEAHYLYGFPYERIDVLIHPSSIVHSLVEYVDGSVIAQMANHDMRIPIQYALTYPERLSTGLPRLNLAATGALEFRAVPADRFPAFATVLDAAGRGGTALAAVNAADEVLVSRFLRNEIRFGGIAQGVAEILRRWDDEIHEREATDLEVVRRVDAWARAAAASCVCAD
ncbi:MAG: 1-deoxy-D-xylulose-5-phosphate reductoisomerase, partial [Candidatus Bipolaricaulota bacterium]